jgi:hypothetical protein
LSVCFSFVPQNIDAAETCEDTSAHETGMFAADTFTQLSRFLRDRPPAAALLIATALLCFTLIGCSGDYCITGIFNPTGIVTGTNNPCVNNKVLGNVSVRIASASVSTDGSMTPNLLHLFVTLQGIEAHPSAMATEESPDWEELAPDLAREPMQIDLLAHPVNSCATHRIPGAAVPAGAYRQIRMRLVPSRPAAGDAVPAASACGELGFHCAVSPNGHIHPLTLVGGATNLRIPPEHISGGFFHVLPDTETQLTIEFNPFASFAVPSGDTVQLTPIFNVGTAASCATAVPSEH